MKLKRIKKEYLTRPLIFTTFGDFMRYRRTELRLTQGEVAEMVGTNTDSICMYETGKRSTSLNAANRMLDAVDSTLVFLTREELKDMEKLLTIDDYCGAYQENARFKEYVDKYCEKHGCTLVKAFKDDIVRSVYETYKEGGANDEI